jgi:hypothetical protein
VGLGGVGAGGPAIAQTRGGGDAATKVYSSVSPIYSSVNR